MTSSQATTREDLAVVPSGDGFHVVAQRGFCMGEVLFEVHGVATKTPRRYSLQVGAADHLDVPSGLTAEEQQRRYVWSFLDHACEPNARFDGRTLRALRGIEAGETVTFHYATTEWAMAEPFHCRCGSAHCLGEVRGFRALPMVERQRLRAWLAPHLLARFEAT